MARARTAQAATETPRRAAVAPRRAAGKEGEHVEVLSSAPLPADDEPTTRLRPILEQPNAVVGDATAGDDDHDARAEAEAPQRRYAIVTKGGKFLDKQGFRTSITTGKEVDSLNYDFAALQRAGIGLRPITEAERGQFIEG